MNVITLPSTTAARVGQMLRLLISDRPGEVVAAASALKRTLAIAGLDLNDFAGVAERALRELPEPMPMPEPAPDMPNTGTLLAMVHICLSGGAISDRERDFLRNLSRLIYHSRRFEISERQFAWLAAIYERVRSEQ